MKRQVGRDKCGEEEEGGERAERRIRGKKGWKKGLGEREKGLKDDGVKREGDEIGQGGER